MIYFSIIFKKEYKGENNIGIFTYLEQGSECYFRWKDDGRKKLFQRELPKYFFEGHPKNTMDSTHVKQYLAF